MKGRPKIFTDAQDKALAQLEVDAAQLADNRNIMKTQEGFHLLAIQRQLIEILLHGESKTVLPPRHHG